MNNLHDLSAPAPLSTLSWWFWIKGGIGFTVGVGIAMTILWPIYVALSIGVVGGLLSAALHLR